MNTNRCGTSGTAAIKVGAKALTACVMLGSLVAVTPHAQAQSQSSKDRSKAQAGQKGVATVQNRIRVARVNADIEKLVESIIRTLPGTGPTFPGPCDLMPRTPFGGIFVTSDECESEPGYALRLVSIKGRPNMTIALVRRQGDAFVCAVTLEHPGMTTMAAIVDTNLKSIVDMITNTVKTAIDVTINSGTGSGNNANCNGAANFCPIIIIANPPPPASSGQQSNPKPAKAD